MSTRPKAFLKQAKSKSKKEQPLNTADDFQAAGVDFEDAAGKWRAGDAVKSMRFFQRAIEVYTRGLQKHPNSFDLAYNKARVELEISTHPVLVKQLQIPVLAQLEKALQSHRVALHLDSNNPDLLFNTSQVLTSIAEEITKNDDANANDAVQLLEEALNFQTRCLEIQETKYTELTTQDNPGTPHGSSSDQDEGGVQVDNTSQMEDQWFTIVEPVTVDVLIDSVIAQLNTLTTLCGILSSPLESTPSTTLPWVEKFSSNLLLNKLPSLLTLEPAQERQQEAALAKANFISSLLEAGFRTNTIDITTYKTERDAAFTSLDQTDINSYLSDARSILSFTTATADTGLSSMRWTALTTIITNLTKASKLPALSADDTSKTHLLRGDASLQEYIMSLPPTSFPAAIANSAQLLKNATVFYRNASKLASEADEKDLANLRALVAMYIGDRDQGPLKTIAQTKGEAWTKMQIEDMAVEGLLPSDFAL